MTRTPHSGLLWLARAFEQLRVHPATQWLMHPGYQPMLWAGAPSPAACTALIDWWAARAPGLAYPATRAWPASIGGWPIGDLLQVLSPQRRTRDALVQTPYWVAELILDQTLIRAADEFGNNELLRTIDPACGTGNFLILAVDYLWRWWTTGTVTAHAVTGRPPVTGGPVHPPAKAIGRILASVDGVELDPMTAAVARFRMTIYIGHLMVQAGLLPGPLRLHAIPPTITPRVAVGDSLLLGKVSRAEYTRLHPHLAALPGAAFPLHDFTWPGDTPTHTDGTAEEATMKLRHESTTVDIRELVRRLDDDELRMAGTAGGPAWDVTRRATLFSSMEQGWPIGPMLAWSPSGLSRRRWYLLDGHRRTSTLISAVAEEVDLVRDITVEEPTYLPASQARPDGIVWPVNALVLTMRFLRIARTMPQPAIEQAELTAKSIRDNKLAMLLLLGGTPATVAQVCDRLLPGRVDPAVLEQIAAAPHQ